MGVQFNLSRQKVKSSQHDHNSYLLCASALNSCIVVMIISSSTIHRTRHHGVNNVLRSSLLSHVLLELKDPCVVGICADALKRVEPDKHVQVKNGLTSARYPVELVESFLMVVREDLRGNEELSDVAVLLSWTVATQRLLGRRRFC